MWPNLISVILTTKTMAKYGKNNYFDGVILPEPKEEMLRRMAKGVRMGYNQYIDNAASTMFRSPSMSIGTNDFTLEYFGNLYGAISSNTPLIFNASAPYAYSRGCLLVYGAPKIAIRWIIFQKPSSGDLLLDSIDLNVGNQEDIVHFVLTRKGTTVKVYVNGELKATKEQSVVKDLGYFRLGMANSSNIIMSRIYNYALSAEEVAALYNDGDPAGYVLPAAMKGLTPFDISGQNSYTWTGDTDSIYSRSVLLGKICESGTTVSVKGTVSNYQSGAPFIYVGETRVDIPAKDSDFTVMVAGSRAFDRISYYGGLNGSDRRLTITIDSVEPVGCTAEYLPRNLIPTAQGDVLQWFDSAPQFPEANGILPPLDASVGGYDLQVTGNPKIII
nr:MAG TPA: Concanavalin A-like lectin/glucanase superfamily protein [Caudoviricetes sp.]